MTDVKKPLTDHEAYFERYGEHLGECGDCREAWRLTERDLLHETGVYRRYMSYQSFAVALSLRKGGKRPMVVTFKCVDLFFKKV